MDLITINQNIQYIAWFLAIAELIIGLYILVLNPRHTANRHVGVFLLISAVNTYALGMMVTAGSPGQAYLSAVILAMTTSATEPLLLVSSVALLRPDWLHSRRRWLWWPIYGLVVLPAALTLIDLQLGTSLWFTGIDPNTYTGGFIISPDFTSGSLSAVVRAGFILSFLIIILFLLFVAIKDKHSSRNDRRLAWILLLQQFLAGALLAYFGQQVILPSVSVLLANTIFVVTYAYAGFEQMISERSRQRGSLQTRLTAVVLIVSIPVMVTLTAFIVDQAQRILEVNANQNLSSKSEQIERTIMLWAQNHERMLQNSAAHPGISSMNPAIQAPILGQIAEEYPELLYASTLNLDGKGIARSDGHPLASYRDAAWFQQAASGIPISFMVSQAEGDAPPSLISAAPVINSSERQNGVLMFAVDIDKLSQSIGINKTGDSGFVFVVNAEDQVIAHPDTENLESSLDFSTNPAVTALRLGNLGPFTFTDQHGTYWRAKARLLPNGWGVVAQVPQSELLAPLTLFGRLAWITLASSAILLFILAVLMIRQTIRPVRTLTSVTAAVAAGDLSQVAPLESEDEIGALAQSFNSMTDQIRGLISGLETRVTQRTQDLERRAIQLQVAAEVAQEAASIRDLDALLEHTVNLISERFGFYHAGIFVIDSAREYAVLAAASSEGGRRMLVRKHQLKLGQVGIVGHVAASGEPRIALDVGRDAVFFNNPDLPQTHSEMALPMKAHGLVIGVLDVQSTEPAAFSEEDIDILQVLADQIALAMENARLLQASEQSLFELDQLYKKQIGQAWEEYLEQSRIAYAYDPLGVQPSASDLDFFESFEQTPDDGAGNKTIFAPIHLHGYQIGSLRLRREKDSPAWDADDQEILDVILAQVALALESARIQELERQRSHNDQLVSRISARTQSALDLETVMRRAVEEIGTALHAEKVQIMLESNGNSGIQPENGSSSG